MSKIKSYDSNTMPLSIEYNRLWAENVPETGQATTLEGELIRIAGRVIYEYNNNGNWNAVDFPDPETDYYSGEVIGQGDPELSEHYKKMLQIVEDELPNLTDEIQALKALICDPELNYQYEYNQREANIYNAFVTGIIKHVLKAEKQGFKKLVNQDLYL